MYDIMLLISVVISKDCYGNEIKAETTREVFCQVADISQTEFYKAAVTDLNPEIKFILRDYYDYQKEKLIRYTDELGTTTNYKVMRTQRKGNRLELVCERL